MREHRKLSRDVLLGIDHPEVSTFARESRMDAPTRAAVAALERNLQEKLREVALMKRMINYFLATYGEPPRFPEENERVQSGSPTRNNPLDHRSD